MFPNRYQQLITSQLKSINQIDTQKFHIGYKDRKSTHQVNNISSIYTPPAFKSQ